MNARKTPLVAEVSGDGQGMINLYCSKDGYQGMQAGFTETESQELVLIEESASPRGRPVQITRTQYAPLDTYDNDMVFVWVRLRENVQIVHTTILPRQFPYLKLFQILNKKVVGDFYALRIE